MSDQRYAHIENAIVESVDIRLDRGFILSCWVFVKFKGGGQGFGGYALGGTSGLVSEHANQANLAAEFICGVLKAIGIESISEAPGKTIRIGKDDAWGKIKAIGHIVDEDKWFDPEVAIETLRGGSS